MNGLNHQKRIWTKFWIKRLFDLHACIVNVVKTFCTKHTFEEKNYIDRFSDSTVGILCKSNFIETYFIEIEVFLLLLRWIKNSDDEWKIAPFSAAIALQQMRITNDICCLDYNCLSTFCLFCIKEENIFQYLSISGKI